MASTRKVTMGVAKVVLLWIFFKDTTNKISLYYVEIWGKLLSQYCKTKPVDEILIETTIRNVMSQKGSHFISYTDDNILDVLYLWILHQLLFALWFWRLLQLVNLWANLLEVNINEVLNPVNFVWILLFKGINLSIISKPRWAVGQQGAGKGS